MTAPKFAIGDIVTWTTRSGSWNTRVNYGIVIKVTPKGGVTAQFLDRALKPHGEESKFRANKDGGVNCKHASELDVARLKWLAERPSVPRATMRFAFGSGDADAPIGAQVSDGALATPEDLRATAADIITLAEWWERAPRS